VDVVPALDDVVAAIIRIAIPGDAVIILGAGSIGGVPEQLVAALGGIATRPQDSAGGRS
jgi:UDP-N-acetylmuramate-alanine ligase